MASDEQVVRESHNISTVSDVGTSPNEYVVFPDIVRRWWRLLSYRTLCFQYLSFMYDAAKKADICQVWALMLGIIGMVRRKVWWKAVELIQLNVDEEILLFTNYVSNYYSTLQTV